MNPPTTSTRKSGQVELPGLSPVVFSDSEKKEISFAESLAFLRLERELTIFELAEKIRHTTRTVQRWLAGTTVPDPTTRKLVLAILSDPEDEPSAATKKRVEQSHHLIWDKARGWEVRVVIDVGAKVVGKRIRRRLRTRVMVEAIARRDILVQVLTADLGLTVRDRRQKRWAKSRAC